MDGGKDLADKELMTVEKPYYSGQSEKEHFHFGLGLHICQTLCEKHGGTIHLENTPQHGAEVTAAFSIQTI